MFNVRIFRSDYDTDAEESDRVNPCWAVSARLSAGQPWKVVEHFDDGERDEADKYALLLDNDDAARAIAIADADAW